MDYERINLILLSNVIIMKVMDYEIINTILPPNINSYNNESKGLRNY